MSGSLADRLCVEPSTDEGVGGAPDESEFRWAGLMFLLLSDRGLIRHDHVMNEPSGPPADNDASATAETTSVLLAEYGALRAELDRRATIQWNVVALQISSAGVVVSLAISKTSLNPLLLLLPLSSYVFGSRYILHDYHIKLVDRYIRRSLSRRLDGNLQWEKWKRRQTRSPRLGARTPRAVHWNALHPTRLTFEGVAFLALVAAALAAIADWTATAPAWHIVAGLALWWALDVIALVALHVSFRRSS